jgi:hypothetical protein
MLTQAFALLSRYAPVRRTLWRGVYQFLASHYRNQEWIFMKLWLCRDTGPRNDRAGGAG